MVLPVVEVVVDADTAAAEAGLKRVGKGARTAGASMEMAGARGARISRATGGTNRLGLALQNASFQAADFAVQVGGGVSQSRALAQQLPQLLGGFGILGAVLGAVVAAAIPLNTALKGMSDNGTLIQKAFGDLVPVLDAVKSAMAATQPVLVSGLNLLLSNLDRIIVIAGVAATVFSVRWVAGMVAARVATLTLSGALAFLRTALIRTGIGAVIVLAGELVFQFLRLTRAAGGFGQAIGLLYEVAREVFANIRQIAASAVSFLGGQFNRMAGQFLGAISQMGVAASDFFAGLAGGLSGIPGMEGMADTFDAAATAVQRAAGSISQRGVELFRTGSGQISAASEGLPALKSVQKLKDLFASMKDEGLTMSDIMGIGGSSDGEGDGSGGGGGGGKSKASKKLDEELSGQEKRIRDHFDRIKALTQGGLSDKLGSWGNYFSNLASLTGTNNKKLLAISKAFAQAQALVDAWVAHNKVLADPTLPWWARIASAGQVLAAGLGAVQAIQSINEGSGATASSSGGTAAATQAAPAAPQTSRQAVINIQGEGMFSRDALIQLIDQINELSDDGAVTRLAVA